MNIVIDGGLELGSPEVLSDVGAVRTQERAYAGAWSGKLSLVLVPPDDPGQPSIRVGGSVTWPLALREGFDYPVAVWVDGSIALGTSVLVFVDAGDGQLVELARRTVGTSGWLYWSAGLFRATGTIGRIRVQLGQVGTVGGRWYVDELAVQGIASEAVMIDQISANLLTKLSGINGVAPYTTAPKIVTRGWERIDKVPGFPAIYLRMPAIRTLDMGVPYRQVVREARWPVIGFVKDADRSFTQALALLTDMHYAVETDQTLGGLSFLCDREGRAVVFEAEDPLDVDPETARGVQGFGGVIKTTFFTPQGIL